MNTRQQESEEYPTFLGYEIFDEERFTAWTETAGLLSCIAATGAAITSHTPADLAVKFSVTALLFVGSILLGLRAEDRDVQKARVSGRNSVFNGYRQMYPQAEQTVGCNARRLTN